MIRWVNKTVNRTVGVTNVFWKILVGVSGVSNPGFKELVQYRATPDVAWWFRYSWVFHLSTLMMVELSCASKWKPPCTRSAHSSKKGYCASKRSINVKASKGGDWESGHLTSFYLQGLLLTCKSQQHQHSVCFFVSLCVHWKRSQHSLGVTAEVSRKMRKLELLSRFYKGFSKLS